MEMKNTYNEHSPIYNIKAVSRLVGLLPVTLRAWERRYGLPRPERGGQGYRLYSEHDVRILRWLKSQNESGLSIGRAVNYLNNLQSNGLDPASEIVLPPVKFKNGTASSDLPSSGSPSLKNLAGEFLNALIQFDDNHALEVLRRAFAIYTVEDVLIQVVQETLGTLDKARLDHHLPVAVEHYAAQVCMQQMMSMLASSAAPAHSGVIVAACAPGEMHQIGLLMLVVMLRWRGWDVKYLGPDLTLEGLEEALIPLHPNIIMFSASRPETASGLLTLPNLLAQFPHPQPRVLLGGPAFQTMRLPEIIQAIYIQGTPVETVEQIESLLGKM